MPALARRMIPQASDAAEPGPFLGVAHSAKGLVWRERLKPSARALALTLSQRLDIPELLGRVLAARGVALEDAPVFLNPTLKALMPDPSSLVGMDKAARRLADAIERREKVAIFGDYDVDGASSSALMARFLAHHDTPSRIYIPDRIFEGYGPNVPAMEALVREGAKLIVTVDCGTMSFEPIAAARAQNTDVVVIDHHQADERLPDAVALVNPNRQDDVSGLGYLCAAGVTFMVLVATQRELRRRGAYASRPEPELMRHLDLVALATVCDVVPLTGLNRAFVQQGLKVMRRRETVGLRSLADAASLGTEPSTYTLGFIIGPRINAGGRIGDAALGARLLASDDEVEAARIAVTLDKLNRERKAVETQMLDAAQAMADQALDDKPDLPILVLGSREWHKGVVGLVASRLTERFRRPSCVIAWESDARADGVRIGTGSLRSLAGVDIGLAVRKAAAAGLLVKGGGHAMAAGLTLAETKIEAVREFLASEVASSVSHARKEACLDLDGAVEPRGVNPALMELIERAGPYGQSNPLPRFALPACRIRSAKVVGEAHVRATLEGSDGTRLDAIAFRAAGHPVGDALTKAAGLPLHVAGTLRRSTYGGRDKVEVQIDDVADPRAQG